MSGLVVGQTYEFTPPITIKVSDIVFGPKNPSGVVMSRGKLSMIRSKKGFGDCLFEVEDGGKKVTVSVFFTTDKMKLNIV